MLGATPSFAQSNNEVYRIDMVVKEEGAKPRKFSTLLDSSGNGTIRIGSRAPVSNSRDSAGKAVNWNLWEQGMTARAKVKPATVSGKVSLSLEFEMTMISPVNSGVESYTGPSSIPQTLRSEINTLVPLQRATQVLSIDDPITLRRFDLEVTITPVP